MTDDAPGMDDAIEVYQQAQEDLSTLDSDNPDDLVEEAEAVGEFVDDLGELVAEGLDESDARSLCGNLSGQCGRTKSGLWSKVQGAAAKKRSNGSGPRPFDDVVEDDLQRVVIQKTTDSHHKRSYRWYFSGKNYTAVVETQTSKDDKHSHYDWTNFRDDYFDARDGAVLPAEPVDERSGGEEWKQFLAEIIRERREVQEMKGSRTIAIEQLQRQIRQTKAYKGLSDALQRDGLGVDDWPESNIDEVWVANSTIKRLCDENEITTRALQSELSSRDLTSTQINGVSHNAEEATWWRLKREISEPAEFVEKPESARDRVAAQQSQTAAADGGNTTGQVASVGESDGAAGKSGGDDDE